MTSATSENLVQLDGSHGEGGGQILRTALSLALIIGRGFHIRRIRANRQKPGLRPQHLMCVKAAALICDAGVRGADVGSRELTFKPGAVVPRDLTFDIGTAGSTALLLQTIHLPLASFASNPIALRLIGGTFNLAAPSYPFIESTWKAHLAAMGLVIETTMPRAGFYPRGQGVLKVKVHPGKPRAVSWLEIERLSLVRVVAGVAGLADSVAKRMLEKIEVLFETDPRVNDLRSQGTFDGVEFAYESTSWKSVGPGASVSIACHHGSAPPACFVGLGERGKPAEKVAEEAFEQCLFHLTAGGAVDPHSADQILLPLALAEGSSEFSVSRVDEHTRTNAATINAFLGRGVHIEEQTDGSGKVTIDP